MHIDISLIDSLVVDGVTDIFVSSRSGVWVSRDGVNEQVYATCDEPDARALAVELIGRGGRHIDDAQPCVDVALASGVRVHAVLAPVSVGGTEVSIRVPRAIPFTLDDLVASGMLTLPLAAYLRACVAHRATVLVTGATGSGKSTLLAALMAEVHGAERILSIEDVAELRIQHPRVVSLEVRQANYEGRGSIGIDELIRQGLRMRPDRLVLGECRGPETQLAFMAFNTGHEGGGTTLHANSLADVPSRLLSLLTMPGHTENSAVLLAVSAIARVVHIEVNKGKREVSLGRLVRRTHNQGWPCLEIETIDVVQS